jgi:uncharacterized RDD family membrane protein YckC
MTTMQPRPWLRYLARYIDIILYTAIIVIILIVVILVLRNLENDINLLENMSKMIFSGILLLFFGLIEPLLLSYWGTTPGKKLLKIKITKEDNTSISFHDAFMRTIKVWFKGLGLGIPLISFFTQINAYNNLSNDGITSWDKSGGFRIVHEKIATWRIVLATLIVVTVFIAYILG